MTTHWLTACDPYRNSRPARPLKTCAGFQGPGQILWFSDLIFYSLTLEVDMWLVRVLVVCGLCLLQLCSIAAARLHSIVQERPVEKLQESCFIVGSVERILTMSVGGMTFLSIISLLCVLHVKMLWVLTTRLSVVLTIRLSVVWHSFVFHLFAMCVTC